MRNDSIGIVIPTYNEKGNIQKLIDSIFKILHECQIIVVDDSKDCTGTLLDQLKRQKNHLYIIHGKSKGGRGAAVLKGIKKSLKNNRIMFIIEMDADFSHNPNELPKILKTIETCDVVIGSRYIKGSKIIDWPSNRRVFSLVANFMARNILQIPITDYTNGYRCYRRKVLENIDLESIKTKGFFVLSDIAYRIHRKGYFFKEVPSIFLNRKREKSNFNVSEVYEAFITLLKLRFESV